MNSGKYFRSMPLCDSGIFASSRVKTYFGQLSVIPANAPNSRSEVALSAVDT